MSVRKEYERLHDILVSAGFFRGSLFCAGPEEGSRFDFYHGRGYRLVILTTRDGVEVFVPVSLSPYVEDVEAAVKSWTEILGETI